MRWIFGLGLACWPLLLLGQVQTPLVVTDASFSGASCSSIPWNNTVWVVRVPSPDDLVSAGTQCGNATITRFGDLADTDPVTTCPANPGDSASVCSARGETSRPAGDFRTAPPPDPVPDPDPIPPLVTQCAQAVEWNESCLTWVPPIEADGYFVWTSLQSGGPYTLVGPVVDPTDTSTLIPGLVPGLHYWIMTTLFGGEESGPSNEASKLIVEQQQFIGVQCVVDMQCDVSTAPAMCPTTAPPVCSLQ